MSSRSTPARRHFRNQRDRHTIIEALALVTFVVFLFHPGLESHDHAFAGRVPVVRLLGTFIPLPMLGFFHNTLSLFGLVLAVGLVVDDAIVVVEPVEHHIEQGSPPHDAAVQAMEGCPGR